MKKQSKKGFTLVELVIVIAVIAILSAILIPVLGNVISNANDSAAYSNAKNGVDNYGIQMAQAKQSADLSDGYIVVLKKAVEIKYTASNSTPVTYSTTDTIKLDSNTYVFGYKNNQVVEKARALKSGSTTEYEDVKWTYTADQTITVTGLTVNKDSEMSLTKSTVTAIPLNYVLGDKTVSASVWWIKTVNGAQSLADLIK